MPFLDLINHDEIIASGLSDSWCEKNKVAASQTRPEIPGINRTRQIWRPLIIVADLAGGDWPKAARAAAVYLTEKAKDVTIKEGSDLDLLLHIKEAFLEATAIWTDTLKQRLCAREESPWNEIIKGKAINDRWLAERLKPYGIRSRPVKLSGTVRKGYQRSDFKDAWRRYLEPALAAAAGGAASEVTEVTEVTKLMNNNKKVTAVPAVTSSGGEAATPENEPSEPIEDDYPELPDCLDRRRQ